VSKRTLRQSPGGQHNNLVFWQQTPPRTPPLLNSNGSICQNLASVDWGRNVLLSKDLMNFNNSDIGGLTALFWQGLPTRRISRIGKTAPSPKPFHLPA